MRARQVHVLGECHRLLLTASHEGCLYDVATDDEGVYDAWRRMGQGDAREEDELQALLALPRCKVEVEVGHEAQIGSEYHTLVLLLHSVVREAVSLHTYALPSPPA